MGLATRWLKSFKICFSRLNAIQACDGQTDRQTPHDGKDRSLQSVSRVKTTDQISTKFLDVIQGPIDYILSDLEKKLKSRSLEVKKSKSYSGNNSVENC